MWSARASARPDSLMPQVRMTRLAMTPAALAPLGHPPLQVGGDGPLEHVGHLVGHAGDGVDHLVSHRADEPGGGPLGLGDDGGPFGHVGLAQIGVGHLPAPARRTWSGSLDHLVVAAQRDVHHLGDGLAGDVVLGGAEAAADDDPVAPGQGGPEGQHDALVVVPDRLVEVGGDPDGGQVLPQPRRVGVGDLAEQQLGADRHDLDPHAAQAAGLVPSTASAAGAVAPAAADLGRPPSVEVVLAAGEHRHGRGHPDAGRQDAWWPARGGARHMPMAMSWSSVLSLAELRAGIEMPCRPTTER